MGRSRKSRDWRAIPKTDRPPATTEEQSAKGTFSAAPALVWVTLAILLACSLATLYFPMVRAFYSLEINYNEGWNVCNTQAAMQHWPLYPVKYGWTTVDYPFLSVYPVGYASHFIFGVVCLALSIALNMLVGGPFLISNLVGPRVYLLPRIRTVFFSFYTPLGLPLAISVFWSIWQLRNRQTWVISFYFFSSLLVGAAFVGAAGVNANTFFDNFFAISIIMGASLDALWKAPIPSLGQGGNELVKQIAEKKYGAIQTYRPVNQEPNNSFPEDVLGAMGRYYVEAFKGHEGYFYLPRP